jgi:cytochrome c oxidase cbb3-type subunit 3
MSTGWSIFVAALVIINIAGCLWLIWYTSRREPGEPETTGHVWDEDIREYNKPLPRWWVNLFYITIAFSIGYLVYYPGFGNYAGVAGWTSVGEHDAQREANEARLAPLFARFDAMSIPQIARDPEGLRLGASIFGNHCAMCHGADARGARGFPNLADGHWQWGGDPEAILYSVKNGREGVMPPFGAALGSETAITEVAVYVQSLAGQRVDPTLAAAGKPRYEMICAACHGVDGKGNPLLGAPNLTTGAYVYGGNFDAIREGIVKGRHGIMPGQGEILGDSRSRIVAAWVWSLSQEAAAAP